MSVLAYTAPLRETRVPRATSQPDPLNINWPTVRQAFENGDLPTRMPPPARRLGPEPEDWVWSAKSLLF